MSLRVAEVHRPLSPGAVLGMSEERTPRPDSSLNTRSTSSTKTVTAAVSGPGAASPAAFRRSTPPRVTARGGRISLLPPRIPRTLRREVERVGRPSSRRNPPFRQNHRQTGQRNQGTRASGSPLASRFVMGPNSPMRAALDIPPVQQCQAIGPAIASGRRATQQAQATSTAKVADRKENPGDHGMSPGFPRQFAVRGVKRVRRYCWRQPWSRLPPASPWGRQRPRTRPLGPRSTTGSPSLDGGIMDKYVVTVSALNETVPLRIVEPLHFSGEPHCRTSFFPNVMLHRGGTIGLDRPCPPTGPARRGRHKKENRDGGINAQSRFRAKPGHARAAATRSYELNSSVKRRGH